MANRIIRANQGKHYEKGYYPLLPDLLGAGALGALAGRQATIPPAFSLPLPWGPLGPSLGPLLPPFETPLESP